MKNVRTQSRFIVLFAVLFLVSACAQPAPGPTATAAVPPTATNTAAPTATATATPEPAEFVSAACNGQPIPQAAAYDPQGQDIHPVGIIDPAGKVSAWNSQLPQAWKPASVEQLELVACLGETTSERYSGECTYMDGGLLVPSQYKLNLRLVSAQSGETVQELSVLGHEAGVCPQVAVFPSGVRKMDMLGPEITSNQILFGMLPFVDPASHQTTIKAHSKNIWGVSFSPDGKYLASGSEDRTIKVWEVASGEMTLQISGHASELTDLQYSPDGSMLAASTRTGNIYLWEAETGQALYTLSGHKEWADYIEFTPDGKKLLSAGKDGTVRVWDTASGEEIPTFQAKPNFLTGLTITPDGKKLAASTWSDVTLWDLETGNEVKTWSPGNNLTDIVFADDGKILVYKTTFGVSLWDMAQDKVLAELPEIGQGDADMSISPDGKLVALSDIRKIHIWDVTKQKLVVTLDKHEDWVSNIAWSSDQKLLASAGQDGTIIIWDIGWIQPVP